MLDLIWSFMILIGVVYAGLQNQLPALTEGILDSTEAAMQLLFLMAGIVGMWNGFLSIADASGLTGRLARYMHPLIHFLFPHIPDGHPALSHISANFAANLLGLGWACTPTGIEAMHSLQKLNQERGFPASYANHEMCTFLIINISSLQLVPINMIAYRSRYGSTSPAAIVGPGLVATLCTTILAVCICKIMCMKREAL